MSSTNETDIEQLLIQQGMAKYFGYFTISFSTLFLVLQGVYMRNLLRGRKITFYLEFSIVLLFAIAIFDIIQLLAHLASGIQYLRFSAGIATQDIGIEQWTYPFGALLMCGWSSAIACLCYLTLHRFLWLAMPKVAHVVMAPIVSKTFLLLLIIYAVSYIIFGTVVTDARTIFRAENGWAVSPWLPKGFLPPFKRTVFSINSFTNYAVVFFNLPLLVGITIVLRKKRTVLSRNDHFIVMQMFTFFVYSTISWVVWEYLANNLTYLESYIVYVFMWMLWNAMKPFASVLQMMMTSLHKKSRKSVATVVSVHPSRRPTISITNARGSR